jgi:hypothetical protein
MHSILLEYKKYHKSHTASWSFRQTKYKTRLKLPSKDSVTVYYTTAPLTLSTSSKRKQWICTGCEGYCRPFFKIVS